VTRGGSWSDVLEYDESLGTLAVSSNHFCTPSCSLHLFLFSPLHLFFSSPLRLFASSPLDLFPLYRTLSLSDHPQQTTPLFNQSHRLIELDLFSISTSMEPKSERNQRGVNASLGEVREVQREARNEESEKDESTRG